MKSGRRSPSRAWGFAFVGFFVVQLPRLVEAAATKDQCIDANTQAQDLARAQKLLDARTALRVCVADSCPKLVREDCAKRLDDLEASIPSITFDVKDSDGHDLSAVVVWMDDKPFVDHLDGSAIDVDPGVHSFRFQATDLPVATVKLVTHVGERRRRESVTLASSPAPVVSPVPPAAAQALPSTTNAASPAPAAGTQSAVPPAVQPATSSMLAPQQTLQPKWEANAGHSSHQTVAWLAVGVGAAGIGVGAITAQLANNKKHTINADAHCAGDRCAPSEIGLVNSYNQLRTVSSVGFIAGGLLAATGVVILIASPHRAPQTAALWVGAGSVGIVGAFQ